MSTLVFLVNYVLDLVLHLVTDALVTFGVLFVNVALPTALGKSQQTHSLNVTPTV